MNCKEAMILNFIDVVVSLYLRGCSIPAIAGKLHCGTEEVASICHEVRRMGMRCDIYLLYERIYLNQRNHTK